VGVRRVLSYELAYELKVSLLEKHPADDSIRAALAGDDPAAVELLWDRYARDLLALLQSTLCSRHDAEDVLQTLFVRIVQKRRTLAKAGCLDAYVYRMARNEVASYVRRRRRRDERRAGADEWLAPRESGQRGCDLTEQVQTALNRLPRGQREVVVLKTYRDKTFAEIGRLLGVSLNTAASRYRYAMERLRSLLKDAAP
jgi:RNA polymerase sigma-70 factor (ECF subfamily)